MEVNYSKIIQRVLSGDETAFTILVQKFQKGIHSLAWKKIGDYQIAEEITQDTFLKAYNKLDTLKNPDQFPGWLYVIANRLCNSWLRNRPKSTQSVEITDEIIENRSYSKYMSDEKEYEAIEHRRYIVQKLMEKLPESERTVMVLHYLGEMSCEAISRFLGVSQNTIKSRLARARNRLKNDETIFHDTFRSVQLSNNLVESIRNEIKKISHNTPNNFKPLPWGIVASTIIMMFLIGMGNQLISPYQNPYNVEAQSQSSIEILNTPIVQNRLPQPKAQTQNGNNITKGRNQNKGLSAEVENMQNDSIDDTMQLNLPKDAIARFGKGGIRDILYSPDGSTLAVAGKIGLWLYDTSTYEVIDMIPLESTEFNCLAYSVDGIFFAAGDRQGTIHLVNKETGNKTEINAHTSWVNGLSFNPEGTILASAGRDYIIQLWDVNTGEHIKTLLRTNSEIQCITFSPDGETLASGENNVIRFFDIDSGNEKTLNAHSSWVDDLSYSPDGKSILSISDPKEIFLWDVNTLQKKILDGPVEGFPTSVDFNPDGRIIATGSWDNKVHLWHGPTGEYITAFSGHTSYVVSVVFNPDGKSVASAAEDGTIRFWELETGTLKNSLTGHIDTIHSVTFFPNGTQLISGNADGTLNVWNIKSRSLVRNITSDYKELDRVVFNENGDIIACGIEEIVIINKDNPEQQRVLSKIKKGLHSFEITSDGKTYATGHEDKNIYLWDSKTGKLKNTLSGHTDYVYSTAFNPDNTLLASGNDDNTVRLWDVESGKEKMILTGHTKGVKSVTFSPDGKTLASGDGNKTIFLWDVITGEKKKTLIGHTHWVFCLAYSPNGKILASGGVNNIINLWNPITGDKLKTFTGHTAWIRDIAFSPDGRILASTGDDGTVLLWEIDYSELIP
ncbi:sigma-70 family RNA polymerase sigma factor [Candidatus Poribacteria bacterium]|nr:sigma-70 family RNA polymerase sigma factor [Candidatus Poribacteria bacterium]